ncbi:Vesicle-associated protein 2-2 [Camellia lanceoleosa]|uniref:Vesicle-associated protein 2-2 n=1 Tax=Camellia lanceoleosa TaxID=1840588 RepID=A0ACC0IJ54_9ERIC|nr:Vesicle-associated protein 2-2 [Camellia lanceoleosa]
MFFLLVKSVEKTVAKLTDDINEELQVADLKRTSDDDITPSIFAKDDVRYVEENKLKVVLVSPPNSPVLSPINRTLKQLPAYEPSILKDQVLRKVESLTQRHTVTEDVESEVENREEANSAKNLEYKTRKDADEPVMNVEHKTRMDVDEPTTDVEHKTMNDMKELKLVKDVSEMMSKLKGLGSKLSEVEVIISKLTEERRLNAELLEIHPRELKFIFKMQAQRVAPPDMICKDMFLVQSTVVPAGTSDDDITPSIFAKDDVRYVEENKLKVVLVGPPNSPVLSPINRTLKQVPAYEPSILKDQVLRKVESLTQRHTVTEDVESKVENSEEANSTKNLEYKTRKDADEPVMNVGYKTRKEVDEPTTDVEHKTRMDVDEPTTDVEHKTTNDMEELKLVKDVSEMKSKLNGLESKRSEAEVIISKLTEERRLNAQERESSGKNWYYIIAFSSCLVARLLHHVHQQCISWPGYSIL